MNTPKREPNIDVIHGLLGTETTLLFLEAHGGQRRRIPGKPTAWIIESIGADAAALICRHYAYEMLTIPMAAEWKRRRRNQAIRHDYDVERLTNHELVRKYGVSEVTIRAALKGSDTVEDAKLPTFGGLAHMRDHATADMFTPTEEPRAA